MSGTKPNRLVQVPLPGRCQGGRILGFGRYFQRTGRRKIMNFRDTGRKIDPITSKHLSIALLVARSVLQLHSAESENFLWFVVSGSQLAHGPVTMSPSLLGS